MNPSAAGSQQCVSSVSVARSQPTRGAVLRVMLCVKRSSRASAGDARCLFYRRLLCLKAKCWAFGQWWLTRPAVKASAEATSHRFETSKAASAPSFGFCGLLGARLESWAKLAQRLAKLSWSATVSLPRAAAETRHDTAGRPALPGSPTPCLLGRHRSRPAP